MKFFLCSCSISKPYFRCTEWDEKNATKLEIRRKNRRREEWQPINVTTIDDQDGNLDTLKENLETEVTTEDGSEITDEDGDDNDEDEFFPIRYCVNFTEQTDQPLQLTFVRNLVY